MPPIRASKVLALCQTPGSVYSAVPQPRPCHRAFTQNHDPAMLKRSVQIYHSASTDPYLNLSIEHHLLQRSAPESYVLFLYANRPCVVIGRNQNPWLEVNLCQLSQGLLPPPSPGSPPPPHRRRPQVVDLVRRRSGGGTVFHDGGNLNWSVICPPAAFDRDRHAEMVARALRGLGVGGARVNERHDIVVDDAATTTTATAVKTFKVSGSAYKLTRLRSLHHGTCLLSSPNLAHVSALLRSPAEPFIKARGVESVRSAIRNVGVGNGKFVAAVVREFRAMYDCAADAEADVDEDAARGMPEIARGVEELKSLEWIYNQTPQFTFSTHPTEDDPRPRPPLPETIPSQFRCHLTIRHGEIQDAAIAGLDYADDADAPYVSQNLVKQHLNRIVDWREALLLASPGQLGDIGPVGGWLNGMFGKTP
ncbi:hypothetical protein B0H67DRAFT_558186 [Lasiosphaeris hirsuta]|uniref:Putative lipoate-protein ligase A n=1 Tax=Lasiosphaeris hirsuta TaxID=260670 RepID=A0AA40DLW3_9PEZI|nr:hypothetical protein B0H67DRAFT_558186 [Lasiosphaeris hirsuta]